MTSQARRARDSNMQENDDVMFLCLSMVGNALNVRRRGENVPSSIPYDSIIYEYSVITKQKNMVGPADLGSLYLPQATVCVLNASRADLLAHMKSYFESQGVITVIHDDWVVLSKDQLGDARTMFNSLQSRGLYPLKA